MVASSSTLLLSALAVLYVNMLFPLAMLQHGPEPRWVLLHVSLLLFYAALYLRGLRRHLRPGLRRGLGYTAAALASFITAIFFYSFAPGVPLQFAVAVWIGLAVAAYFAYLVIVLHTDEEHGLSQAQQVLVRPPV